MGGKGFFMRIFQKTALSAFSVFTAATLAFPVIASASPISGLNQNYTVQNGDSFWKIADEYGITVQSLMSANSGIPIFNLQIGTDLIIPLGKTENSVQKTTGTSHASKAVTNHAVAHERTNPNAWSRPVSHESASSSSNTASSSAYAQNLYWMAHVINAEANAEPMKAQIGVGDVVLHRLESSSSYRNIHDVVFAVENGHYQFTCVANGYIYSTPTSSAEEAAREVLSQHVDVVPGASVFFNPAKTPSSSWVWNQPRITTIGDFIFSK